jgi:ABC-type sugar transport system ATPase subunit
MIDVRGLRLTRGGFSLAALNLSVSEGDCLVIVGASGAGKTLLLEAILGIERPNAGQVTVGGVDVTRAPLEERGFSFVPQDLALFPHLGVEGNIAFALQRKRLTRDETSRRVREVASWLGISYLLGRPKVDSLSGGEKQRVALARAIVAEPRVLVLDEPFSSLDCSTRCELHKVFATLRQRMRLTTLLVTHNHDEAFLFGDRVAVLVNGSLVQFGTPQDVYRRPATIDVAKLLLVENVLLGECLGQGQSPHSLRCRVGSGELEAAASFSGSTGQRLWLGIRAHHVRKSHVHNGTTNIQSAIVRRTSPRTDGLLLELSLPLTSSTVPFFMAIGDGSEEDAPEVGDKLTVEIPPARVIVGNMSGTPLTGDFD